MEFEEAKTTNDQIIKQYENLGTPLLLIPERELFFRLNRPGMRNQHSPLILRAGSFHCYKNHLRELEKL